MIYYLSWFNNNILIIGYFKNKIIIYCVLFIKNEKRMKSVIFFFCKYLMMF